MGNPFPGEHRPVGRDMVNGVSNDKKMAIKQFVPYRM